MRVLEDKMDDRKNLMLKLKPDSWRRLKMLAVEKDTTLQDIVCDRIEEYLADEAVKKVRVAREKVRIAREAAK